MIKTGSICLYLDKCIIFMNTGCDGKDYPECSYKKELEADWGTEELDQDEFIPCVYCCDKAVIRIGREYLCAECKRKRDSE